MRRRSHLTADEWRRRLDECMARVLAAPASFPEASVLWARWRKQWLASQPASPCRAAGPSRGQQYSLPLQEERG
jgi:hypothetical protein